VALSDLSPSGKAEIEGRQKDVRLVRGYLPAGSLLVVVGQDGHQLLVESRVGL